ncbi:Dihydrofolate synthase / Folylpolyglutamate synthase [Spironucleus salmonicida]|uniref:Dihydrofolate synthase / Folylpolyglutamate synthase n=1 Tax=Spironucleus salmonicida TaxID=348837 RepID=S5UM00_9EUKA|nr:FolC bifunctional family protein [Spironucleus salmonicida]KAH0571305.1 Dihydrofolate synthase / Folylpolyglutamate synthase [Spironucleus salmonicida]|eukprot:EST46616.1 FolC bifunctional family protein [Spironucleus salmonicida]
MINQDYKNLLKDITKNASNHPVLSLERPLVDNLFHITGSKGKTTTANYVHQLLPKQTPIFSSPHCFSLKERIRDYNLLSDTDFTQLFTTTDYSFFGNLTHAFINFLQRQTPKNAVIEVGIGGLMDTTFIKNISQQKIGILTSVELEHQDLLGNNLQDILFHKLAIFQNADHVIVPQNLDLLGMDRFYQIQDKIKRVKIDDDWQRSNERLARRAVFEAGIQTYNKVSQQFPGRNIQIDNFFIDCAHTVESVKKSLINLNGKKCKLIFSQTRKTRDWRSVLRQIYQILNIQEAYYLPTSSSLDYRDNLLISETSKEIGNQICQEVDMKMIQNSEIKNIQGDVVVLGSTHLACLVQWLIQGEKALDFFNRM